MKRMVRDMKRAASAPRIVALYTRVSTAEQAASGLGLESQLQRCRAYVDALGLGDGAEVQVFCDAGESAATTDRPELQRLLDAVRRRRVSVVVVAKLDRLTRSVRDLLDLADTFAKHGAALASVSERIDASSATGRLMLQLLGVFAEFEREQICERSHAAAVAKRRRGEAHGFVPFGAQTVAGRLQSVAAEVEAVDLMIRRRAEGASLRAIASELTAAGFATKRGGAWRACTVDVILRRVDRERREGIAL